MVLRRRFMRTLVRDLDSEDAELGFFSELDDEDVHITKNDIESSIRKNDIANSINTSEKPSGFLKQLELVLHRDLTTRRKENKPHRNKRSPGGVLLTSVNVPDGADGKKMKKKYLVMKDNKKVLVEKKHVKKIKLHGFWYG